MSKLPDMQAKTIIFPSRGSSLPPGQYTDSLTAAIEHAERRAKEEGVVHFVYLSSKRRPGYEYRIVSKLWPSVNFEKAVAVTDGGRQTKSMLLDPINVEALNRALAMMKRKDFPVSYADVCMAIVNAMGGKDNAEQVIRELIRLAGLSSEEVSISSPHSTEAYSSLPAHTSGQTRPDPED